MVMRFTAPYSIVPAGSLALRFHPDHLADLRASGLSDETIRSASVYSLCPCDIARFFNLRRGIPEGVESALCFPYQGGDFARIKLFAAPGKMKYSQPPATGARLYVPFTVSDGPLWVCEGEKKTLAAHQAGLNAIGIGGVWNWLNHGDPIDDLDRIDWNDREVTIAGDSDVWRRVDLLRALYALGSILTEMGATVDFLELPQGNMKVGLDDYLVMGGDISALPIHSLGSRDMAHHRLWYRRWKVDKAIARGEA